MVHTELEKYLSLLALKVREWFVCLYTNIFNTLFTSEMMEEQNGCSTWC